MSTRTYSYAHKRQYWTSYANPEARKGRSGRPYRRFRAELKAIRPPICVRCGGWIDLALHHTDPWSWTLDHLDPLAEHGAPLNKDTAAPAHRRCNQREQPRGRKGTRTWPARAKTLQPVADRRW